MKKSLFMVAKALFDRFYTVRFILIFPIVIIFIFYSLSAYWLSRNSYERVLSRFMGVYASSTSDAVNDQLTTFFLKAIKNADYNAMLIKKDILKVEDTDKIIDLFMSEVNDNPYLTYVSVGFENGDYYGIGRIIETGEMKYLQVDQSKNGLIEEFEVTPALDIGDFSKNYGTFDPRKRGWYVTAKRIGTMSWYPVYHYASQDALGFGVSVPFYTQGGDFAGVLTSDLALNQISKFLSTFDLGENGMIYISENTGEFIGTSSEFPIYKTIGDEIIRETLITYPDPRVVAALSDSSKLDEGRFYKLDGKKYFIKEMDYEDDFARRFKVGVILSFDDFASYYQGEFWIYTVLAMLAFLLPIVVLALILRSLVIPPIERLVEGYDKVKMGDFTVRLRTSGSREIKKLTIGFNEMVEAINSSKNLEREYIAHERMAALGALASGVTHEVNTPLGIAITAESHMDTIHKQAMQLFESGKMTKAEFQQYKNEMNESFEILNRNLIRSAELISSFKALAAGQTNEMAIHFNVCELVEHIIVSLKHAYKKKGHHIDVFCEEKLVISSYPSAFTQILTNLIMNSIVHGFGNKKNGTIAIYLRMENHFLIMDYQDDGIGMSEEVLDKIYLPFFTTNRENGGTGIGMNIVHSLVTEKLEGEIEIFSEVNEGSRFYIRIPLSPEP